MSIHDSLYTKIAATTGITDVISTRFYPMQAPTSARTAFPYATYQRISEEHLHHTRAAAGLCNALIQIDIWDDDIVQCYTVADAFRAALHGMTTATWGSLAIKRVLLQGVRDDFTPPEDGSETGRFRISMDWDIWYAESIPSL